MSRRRPDRGIGFLLFMTLGLACGRPPAAGGGFPPMPVEVVTLEPAPVERTFDSVATLKSRRSTTVRPMVDGIVTRIVVRSGDRVRAGDLLLEIEASRQRAVVATLESVRAARLADLTYARSEAERQKALFEQGVSSVQDYERAKAVLESAESLLKAADEQLAEQRVELGYHGVTAPVSGAIGDVPIRVGDRVTTATVLTAIDAVGDLEAYIHVPVGSAGALRSGLPVRILGDDGTVLATTGVGFVSERVEDDTQTVLVKAPIPDASGFRTEQQVRARVVWSEEPGLRIPVVAVMRVGGQCFAFVVDEAEGKPVARQKVVRLGPIVGNDYLVLDGVSAGERLIVSGVQKIRDGAPVDPKPHAGEARG